MSDLNVIFERCWHFRVVNVVVLLYPQYEVDRSVHIYTYYPFNENNCRKLTIKLLSVYKGGRVEKIQFFPKKMENFHRCPLRVAARNYPPFFMRKTSRHCGIEGLILEVLAEHFNFSIDLLPEPKESSSIYTITGVLDQVDHGNADFAIGGLSLNSPELETKYSFSSTYYQSPIVLVVKRGVQFGPIEQLFKPFDGLTWFLNFFLYLSGIVVILCVSKSRGWTRSYLMGKTSCSQFQTNFFAMTLGYSIKAVPRGIVVRIILTSWLLYSYFMRTAYQGAMFDSIRKNCETRIPETIDGLIKEKYEIVTTSCKCSVPNNILSNETKQLNVGYKGIFAVVQSSKQKVAAMVLLDQLSYYNYENNNGRGSNFTLITERFSDKQMLMLFPKHSFLREPFNVQLRKFQENGMIAGYANLYANRKFNKYDVNSGMKPVITGERLLGIFSIFLGMLVFSTFVFAGEILAEKFEMLSRFFEFLDYNGCVEGQQIWSSQHNSSIK